MGVAKLYIVRVVTMWGRIDECISLRVYQGDERKAPRCANTRSGSSFSRYPEKKRKEQGKKTMPFDEEEHAHLILGCIQVLLLFLDTARL